MRLRLRQKKIRLTKIGLDIYLFFKLRNVAIVKLLLTYILIDNLTFFSITLNIIY